MKNRTVGIILMIAGIIMIVQGIIGLIMLL